MVVIQAHDMQAIESPNGNYGTALATPSRGATEVSIIRQRQTPGGFNPVHTQNREEVMVQLSGTTTLTSGETSVVLRAGDVAIIPANTPHRLDNISDRDAEWLIVSAAGVQFFRENGEEARPGWAH